MLITAKITLDVDTDIWSAEYDTEGMTASGVRSQIEARIKKIVVDDFYHWGFIKEGKPK